jgi:hypothetical protein
LRWFRAAGSVTGQTGQTSQTAPPLRRDSHEIGVALTAPNKPGQQAGEETGETT